MKQTELLLVDYSDHLMAFVHDHPGVKNLLNDPDYASVVVADPTQYDDLVNRSMAEAKEVATFDAQEGLRIAAINEMGSLMVQGFGQISWVELRNPKTTEQQPDPTRLTHVGFCFSDSGLVYAEEVLQTVGIKPRKKMEFGKPSLSIGIGSEQSVKLSTQEMGGVVQQYKSTYAEKQHWKRNMWERVSSR